MNCLRCNTEMKHYELKPQIEVYGTWHKPNLFLSERSEPHNIHSVYICDKCGYAELSTKYCDKSDI